MQQKSIVAVLVALVVVLAGATIYLAVSKNAYAPAPSQTVPIQSMAGQIPAATNQTAVQNQTAANNQTSSVNETASWKTYTNSKYKFSIQYPATYKIKEEVIEGAPEFDTAGQAVFAVDFGNNVENPDPDTDNYITIVINKNTPKGGGIPNGMDVSPSEIKYVTTNGVRIGIVRNTPTETLYTAERNGIGFFIEGFSSTDKSVKDNMDKMIKTFKLL